MKDHSSAQQVAFEGGKVRVFNDAGEAEKRLSRPGLGQLLTVGIIYAAIVMATHYVFFADTLVYVRHILSFDRDPVSGLADFWDFGHLLWRPLGWLLFHIFGGLFPYSKTGESHLTLIVLLVIVNILAGLVTVLLFQSLARRFVNNGWASFVAISLLCFHAFLNYIQTGTAYLPGLMWLTLSLWCTVRAVEKQSGAYAVFSGVAGALAALFWFPYIVALPGVLAASLLWRTEQTDRSVNSKRIRIAAATAASAGLALCAGYAAPVILLHLNSIAAWTHWIGNANHGWAQNRRLFRMATGLPRSFLWIGDGGLLMKRYLLHDPYARVTLAQIIRDQLLRLALFYVSAGCLLWVLFRAAGARRLLLIFAAGTVPLLLFAVLIFEPGSIERYLPIYPFLCIALAFCISRYRQSRVAVASVAAALAIAMLVNISALWRSSVLAEHRPTARALSLQGRVGQNGLIALVSLRDTMYELGAFPFEPAVRHMALPVWEVFQSGNERIRVWRREFAERTLRVLSQGERVWISKRLLAARPEPAWGWTEGDDPNVSWKDIRPFFTQLDYAADVGGPDGFLEVAASPRNIAFLRSVAGGQ
jgi:4-amino-4-deoxy-L-arabinose transferase-like glycosyltransferase